MEHLTEDRSCLRAAEAGSIEAKQGLILEQSVIRAGVKVRSPGASGHTHVLYHLFGNQPPLL